ncbi:MAG: Thioredoxin-like [Verrucomicrobiota bacterium]
MKPALFLTPFLALTCWASDTDFWPSRLNGLVEKRATVKTKVAPNKITAIYTHAGWCSPCKSFAPELVSFRDKYNGQFQFILLQRDRQEKSRKQRTPELPAPAIVQGKAPENEPFWNEIRGSGTSQLLVFGPGGDLITRDGRALLERKPDPEKPRNWGNRNAPGYREWEQILIDWHQLGPQPEVTPPEYFRKLQIRHGSSAFWPVYQALIRKPGTEKLAENAPSLSPDELRTWMEKAAEDLVRGKHWEELWRAAELLSEGNLEDGGPQHRADRMATHFFHTAGTLAAGDASFAESCSRVPRNNPVVHSAMLRTLAAAAATGTHYLDEALFWLEAKDYVAAKKNYRILEPLLLAGNPRAYAVMAEAARKKALYHLVKAPLESAAEAGRREPLAILGQMELQYIQ